MTACVHYTTATGEHDRSLALLDTFGNRITQPALLGAIHAMRATTMLNAGRQAEALSSARACLTGEWNGMAWAALARFTEAEVLRRLGETRRPVVVGHDALHLASVSGPLVGVGALRTLALTHIGGGDLDAADEVAARFADTVALQSIPRALACGTMSSAAVARGHFGKARRLALDCLHALPADDRNGLGRGVAAMLAGVRAMLGDVDGARWAQERCEVATLRSGEWPDVNPILSDGFARAAAGEVTIPIARFREAAQISFAHQQVADGVNNLYWAVRFGDRDAAVELCEPRRRGEGPLTGLMVAHADALLDADAARLRLVSDSFVELGYIPFAADAIAHAIIALRSAGLPHKARELSPRLTFLRSLADDFLSPAIRAAELNTNLSPRELEIYAMTSGGRSRIDVADALGIRPSTVTAYRSRVRERLNTW